MIFFIGQVKRFLLVLVALGLFSSALADERFVLNPKCPRGFELETPDSCELRTLYQFYTSTQGRGVGGTHTGLPPHRDGFSPRQIDLGRYLFFDPILSGDGHISCASCHDPAKGFADGKALSVGAGGLTTERSAPSLWNSAFLTSFFWDARAESLEQQAVAPLFSPVEMNNTPRQLLRSLRDNRHYPRMFAEAFPQSPTLSLTDVYTALAAFQSSLISLNSRYDQYAHGNHAALSEQEIAGMNVFRSFVARCAECHTPPLFTNNQIAVIGTPEPAGRPLDIGAEATFGSSKLKGGFKVPSLRNIAHTAPYMHSGVFADLRAASEFYTKGRGHAVPEGVEMQLHWHIWEPKLTDHELDLLVAFLETLSDLSFMPEIPGELPSGSTPAVQIGNVSQTTLAKGRTTRALRASQ
ncbi:MAG: cytochrome-c peroxidase [Gammaproteobacteria bacterium]|nr:cytochrome-c peroxidase [Gammaproteobacteria bacterium]